ncbi:hypothetical protein J2I47_01735 [Fibrella sp. HMF5335]|uniref:Uncharacterized protein n=1 Tax=Fibrella rubiginis TaxID=2817060 RepID=A0A939K1H6_9BACT|nr:hypothetical protein [Fibrella rubiginis]MBO0935259.1 hypothetical protein [Fibrella rubiginis]
MEIDDQQEVAIVTTIRLIRKFSESIVALEKMGATGSANESIRMRDRLVAELKQLTNKATNAAVFA